MTFSLPPGRPSVPVRVTDGAEHRRLIAEGLNRATAGHINATIFVTLDAGADQTVVTDSRISAQTSLIFHPKTADAAAALATTYATCTTGSATIFHDNNTQTDRDFNLGLIG